jgi:hypothetical protein
METDKKLRLGKLPKKLDHRTLQMSKYMATLPVPPSMVDRASRLPPDIGMMGNDNYGDCTGSGSRSYDPKLDNLR